MTDLIRWTGLGLADTLGDVRFDRGQHLWNGKDDLGIGFISGSSTGSYFETVFPGDNEFPTTKEGDFGYSDSREFPILKATYVSPTSLSVKYDIRDGGSSRTSYAVSVDMRWEDASGQSHFIQGEATRDNSSTGWYIKRQTNRILYIVNASTGLNVATGPLTNDDTWYRVCVRSDQVNLYLEVFDENENLVGSTSTPVTTFPTGANIEGLVFGQRSTLQFPPFYMDNMLANDIGQVTCPKFELRKSGFYWNVGSAVTPAVESELTGTNGTALSAANIGTYSNFDAAIFSNNASSINTVENPPGYDRSIANNISAANPYQEAWWTVSTSDIYSRFYYKYSADLTGGTAYVHFMRNASNVVFSIEANTSGDLIVNNGLSGSAVGTLGFALNKDVWYRIESSYSDAPGTNVAVRLYDNQDALLNEISFDSTQSGLITRATFGLSDASATPVGTVWEGGHALSYSNWIGPSSQFEEVDLIGVMEAGGFQPLTYTMRNTVDDTITVTNLAAGSDSINAIANTASVTATSGELLILTVSCAAGDTIDVPTDGQMTVSGLGASWVPIASEEYMFRRRAKVYRAYNASGTGPITLTYTGTNFAEWGWVLDKVTGIDSNNRYTGFTISNGGTGTNTFVNATVGDTPGIGDATYSSVVAEQDTTISVEGTWVEKGSVAGGTDVRAIKSAWDADGDVTHTWNFGASTGYVAFAMTLQVAQTTNGLIGFNQISAPVDATLYSSVSYGADPLQTYDLYTPASPGPHPLLAYVAPGYVITQSGLLDNTGTGMEFIDQMREAGWAVADIGYRSTTSDFFNPNGNRYPMQIVDVKTAIKHILANQVNYGDGIDATKVVVAGQDFGAHLAAHVALTEGLGVQPLGLDPLNGNVDLSVAGGDPAIAGLVMGNPYMHIDTINANEPAIAPYMNWYANGTASNPPASYDNASIVDSVDSNFSFDGLGPVFIAWSPANLPQPDTVINSNSNVLNFEPTSGMVSWLKREFDNATPAVDVTWYNHSNFLNEGNILHFMNSQYLADWLNEKFG